MVQNRTQCRCQWCIKEILLTFIKFLTFVDPRRDAFNETVAWIRQQLLPRFRLPSPDCGVRLRCELHGEKHQRHGGLLQETRHEARLAANVLRETRKVLRAAWEMFAARRSADPGEQLRRSHDSLGHSSRRSGAAADNHLGRLVEPGFEASSVLLQSGKSRFPSKISLRLKFQMFQHGESEFNVLGESALHPNDKWRRIIPTKLLHVFPDFKKPNNFRSDWRRRRSFSARQKVRRESCEATWRTWKCSKFSKATTGKWNHRFIIKFHPSNNFQIYTSELRRAVSTVENIPAPRVALKDLNEIDAGICEGLTYEEIQERFPTEFAWRDQDKLKYRYPHGESYLDLLQRVDGVVQALLLNTEVLVVSHQAVLRCVMAYFKGSKPGEIGRVL